MIAHDIVVDLAGRLGTPLYLYNLDEVATRCAELFDVLPRGSQLFYSLKANPLPAVAHAAKRAGCHAEISSEGELAAAIAAGFDPASMLYTGPAKGEHELGAAFACGVRFFSVESMRDLQRVAAAARAAETTAQVLLRVNPDRPPRAGLAMTGTPSQFGFAEEELMAQSTAIALTTNVDVVGVHTYLGTQLANVLELAETFATGAAVAERLHAIFPIHIADLGGGFSWPFATADAPLDLAPLAGLFPKSSIDDFWFESGRYIAASCGTLITRVIDVKTSRGTTFIVLDAGVAHLGGMSGLGRLLRPTVSLLAVSARREAPPVHADVVGPLCTPLDCLGRGVVVRLPEPGDLLAIPNTGAYGATASLTSFLSRPAAMEVSLRGGHVVDVARLRIGHEYLPVSQESEHDYERVIDFANV